MIITKKSLGQHFLIDKNISKKIVNLSNNYNKKTIFEIGPGKGALTEQLILKNPKKLVLIEKDKNLYFNLIKKYNDYNNIEIYNEDALIFNYSVFKSPMTIISNLPYNISVKLIINWIKSKIKFEEIIVMIQKEVAQKMNYNNIKKNRLNVFIEITSKYKISFNVNQNVFYPRPKVMSSVITIKPKKNIKIDLNKLEIFTRKLFRNKRKKLSNVIDFKNIKNIKNINNLNIFDYRAEDLSLEQIVKLFKEF